VWRTYGYRLHSQDERHAGAYEIDATESEVVAARVRKIHVDGLSIGAIARLLQEIGPPTRRRVTRWNGRSYGAVAQSGIQGTPYFNKTQSDRGKR